MGSLLADVDVVSPSNPLVEKNIPEPAEPAVIISIRTGIRTVISFIVSGIHQNQIDTREGVTVEKQIEEDHLIWTFLVA